MLPQVDQNLAKTTTALVDLPLLAIKDLLVREKAEIAERLEKEQAEIGLPFCLECDLCSLATWCIKCREKNGFYLFLSLGFLHRL